jgi:nitrogen fixation NifU-like protein
VFSEKLLEHFQAPLNEGEMPDADAEAEAENPVCGDRLRLWLKIRDGRIVEATWKAAGCAPAIAAASVTSELLRGMTLDEARALDNDGIEEALGGLPARKTHVAALTVSAVRGALDTYENRQ